MNSRKPEIAAELIEYIETRIMTEEYLPGARLPSVRSLGQKFGLSYGSTLRGIDYLCHRGTLRKSPKRGIFVARGAHDPDRRRATKPLGVLVYIQNEESGGYPGIYYTAFSEIQRMALQYRYELMVFPYSQYEIPAGTLDRLNRQCDGVILLREFDWRAANLSLNIPAVGVMMVSDFEEKLSLVDIDPFNAATQAVRYFRARGIDRLHIYTDPRPVFFNRAKIMAFFWESAGGTVAALHVQSYEKETVPFPARNEGLFCTSDNLLEYLCGRYHRQCGGHLPAERTILGMDGKSVHVKWFHRFPTIAINWKTIGRTAFEECVARMEVPTRGSRRIYLPGKLVEPGERPPGF